MKSDSLVSCPHLLKGSGWIGIARRSGGPSMATVQGAPRRAGDRGQSEEASREAVRIDAADANLPLILGMMAHRDGRHAAALDAFARALAADPANPDVHHWRGAACRALGRSDEAIAAYREALRLRPDYPDTHVELAAVLTAQGRTDEAIACLRQACVARPDDPAPPARLGAILLAIGRGDEAEASFRRALQFDPQNGGSHRHLGLLALRRGRPDEAANHLRESLRHAPGDAEACNELGIALARQALFGEAITAYREALRLRPDYPDAHNNLGNALRNTGKHDAAVVAFREAIRHRPDYPEAYNNLGITLRAQGKPDEAIAAYQQALSLRPSYPDAHNNMGFALASRGRHEAALVCYHQAVRLRPDYFEAHHNLGNTLAELGRPAEAVAAYTRALEIRPDEPRVLKCIGVTLTRDGKLDEAVLAFREALRHRPDFPDAWNDLGIALARQSRHSEAAHAYRQALTYRPNFPEALNNLGNALRCTGGFDESVACYRRALELRPTYADAHNNLGIALAEMGRLDEALTSYNRCLELRPNHVDAHMNRALTWLRKGDYAQGWAEYEWRWRKRALTNRPLIQPAWNGYPLKGRTILLVTEQGLGDAIQFIRYAALLKDQGARVVFECPERLVGLLAQCPGVDQVIPQGAPLPPYDVYAPLLTVPGLVGSSPEAVPSTVPYVRPDPALVEKWRAELDGIRELKVGINWQGNSKYAGDYHRSIPLKHFAPLARVPGVRLFSLQKNEGTEQLRDAGFEVTDLGGRLDLEAGAFQDTAAVLTCLDLFITSDTAVVHLAGALGVPVWMALSTTPDWRWMVDRDDNPWYPTMRVFRQERFMDWDPVFARVAAELRKLVPATAPTRAVTIETSPGELIDKITILEIKAARITDPAALRNVRAELDALQAAHERTIVGSEELDALTAELRSVNETLWDVEDGIRVCERDGDFGERFVALARSVYQHNDRRAALKRQINLRLGSGLVEEKSYPAADARGTGRELALVAATP
jgi:tetratricopeptide (TPR) repeat protein